MKLIAVRHSEAEWNLQQREMGQLDSPLTERGRRQAIAIADRLRCHRFTALYSSDLGRAVKTAQAISAVTGVKPQLDAALRERHMGIFQGFTETEMQQRFPAEYGDYRRIGHMYQIPQGESGQQRLERGVRAFERFAHRHPDETIVVVTHGGLLRGFFEHVMGIPPGNGWRFKRQNASYNAFEFVDGKWTLETWNDTSHLRMDGSLDDSTA